MSFYDFFPPQILLATNTSQHTITGNRNKKNKKKGRLEDLQKEYPKALEIGCGSGHLYKALLNTVSAIDASNSDPFENKRIGGIKEIVQTDFCEKLLFRDEITDSQQNILRTQRIVADEEEKLPFDGIFMFVHPFFFVLNKNKFFFSCVKKTANLRIVVFCLCSL